MNVAVTGQQAEFTSLEDQTDFRPLARALGTVADIPADTVIFREGDPPRCMYLVLTGRIEVSSKNRVIETIHEGQALGILSLLEEKPRAITARAIEPCELVLLDKVQFRTMVKEAPHFVWFALGEVGSELSAIHSPR